jgi:arylsulfatase A-like enzyme
VLDTLPEPWLLVVSLHAPHVPLHTPPSRLLTEPLTDDAEPAARYRAMLEAVDAELGRFLRQIEPAVLSRTQLWTMSDNGTPRHGILPPLDPARSKGTLFEGGVRVPLIVTGSGVEAPGRRSDALVSLLDVAPSAVRVAGGTPLIDADGLSLVSHLSDPDLPGHDTLYADITRPDGRIDRAVRSDHLKVVRRGDAPIELWTLGDGLDEEPLTADGVPLVPALDLLTTLEAWERDLGTP